MSESVEGNNVLEGILEKTKIGDFKCLHLVPRMEDTTYAIELYEKLRSRLEEAVEVYVLAPQRLCCFSRTDAGSEFLYVVDCAVCTYCSDQPFQNFLIITEDRAGVRDYKQDRAALRVPEDLQTDHTSLTPFLVSRISRLSRLRERKIFGIFYTCHTLQEAALRTRAYLRKKLPGASAYLLFLRDTSYERLTCIECDGIVLLDCPHSINFRMDLEFVTPFELHMELGAWAGDYGFHNICEQEEERGNVLAYNESALQLMKNDVEVYSDLLRRSEYKGVEYYPDEQSPNNEVVEGRSGIAAQYTSEGPH